MSSLHGRAKAIFLDVITRRPDERAAVLQQACAGDDALRHEVEALLSFHDADASRTPAPRPRRAPTRIIRDGRAATAGRTSLPRQLVDRAARRLQIVCSVMGLVIVTMWGGVNYLEGELADEFVLPSQWVPPVGVLLASAGMFIAARRRLDTQRLMRLGLAYQVIVSAALAVSQYAGAFRGVPAWAMNGDRIGLAYVATWTLFFSVLVPARPRETLVALVLSNATVPLVYWQQVTQGWAPALPASAFASLFIWPYVAGTATAYVAARIVHQLGVDVGRAHELGGYRLEAPLGRGGMGEVWRATHHTLARPAAIKLIRRDALGDHPTIAAAMIQRFEAEAQVIASLESPHTIELYDFGTTEDGTLFYVMELLDGVDLEVYVRRHGPLPAGRVIHVLRQVCASLEEAHHRGLVHRDIKPANLYVCRRGLQHDVVKVLDFGLASTFADARRLSTAGARVIGTPQYMAPEIVTGGVIDGRADLYSLGCVAFWLLTARHVFPHQDVTEVLAAHAHADPPAPSTHHPDIPAGLDQLILSCLAKDPAMRPPNARALSTELAALAQSHPWAQER